MLIKSLAQLLSSIHENNLLKADKSLYMIPLSRIIFHINIVKTCLVQILFRSFSTLSVSFDRPFGSLIPAPKNLCVAYQRLLSSYTRKRVTSGKNSRVTTRA